MLNGKKIKVRKIYEDLKLVYFLSSFICSLPNMRKLFDQLFSKLTSHHFCISSKIYLILNNIILIRNSTKSYHNISLTLIITKHHSNLINSLHCLIFSTII